MITFMNSQLSPSIKSCSFLFLLIVSQSSFAKIDVTIVGHHKFSGGIQRRPIGLIKALKDSLNINYINTRPEVSKAKDIEKSVLEILQKNDDTPGAVAFLVDIIPHYQKMPSSKIKLAFATVESTQAPQSWVKALNSFFDGMVVPDIWLVDIFKNSGVKIPIFVVPEICYLEDLLDQPGHKKRSHPFVFGVSATAGNSKNYNVLLEAFAAEFGNRSDVILKIHNPSKIWSNRIHKKKSELNLTNVITHNGPLSWQDYIKTHMVLIDCYILISRGEGFSITPREAMALGRPCILANHTAHTTICNSGFVIPVAANILTKDDAESYGGEFIGYNFNCEINDVRKAMREVFENYEVYLEKASRGKEWVKQYLGSNLKARYLSLFKPKNIIFGASNEVTSEYLMTNSQSLYNKYLEHAMLPQ